MSRRHVNRAPVELAITSSEAAQQFFQHFTDAFEDEFHSQKIQGEINHIRRRPATDPPEVIGSALQSIVWGIISAMLGHRGELSSMLADLDAADRDRMLQQIGDFAAGAGDSAIRVGPRPLIWCEHHGYTPSLRRGRCLQCPCDLPVQYGRGWSDPRVTRMIFFSRRLFPGPTGRRRKYCSNACRQRAYRQRQAELKKQQASGAPVRNASTGT